MVRTVEAVIDPHGNVRLLEAVQQPASTPQLCRMTVKIEPGTYVLWCSAESGMRLEIGRLGQIQFRAGIYAYVGSALGAGGLQARLAHHFRLTEKPHWHIDHLRSRTRIEAVWYSYGLKRREHRWAAAMGAMPRASVPVAGFGSSDCHCLSHLFFFDSFPSVHAFAAGLSGADGEHSLVHRSRWLTGGTPERD